MENNKNIKNKSIALITLGCDKNTVESEQLLAKFTEYGFKISTDLDNSEIIVVNTCSFIHDARIESESVIKQSIELKNKKKCEKVIVVGCLTASIFKEFRSMINGVDLFIGFNDYDKIISLIEGLYNIKSDYRPILEKNSRILSEGNYSAYLKISDGCNNNCSFCTIPKIRGKYRSIAIEQLVKEAKELSEKGVTELILVAQDTTRYGVDLYKKFKIVELLKLLSQIEEIRWIRLHYMYPEILTDELIDEIVNNGKVCKYVDIPLQHISNRILKNMNRAGSKESIQKLVKKIRSQNQYISIRSTFIVGFPGERFIDFLRLKFFLIKYKLDNVGFFTYAREQFTESYNMKNQLSEKKKNNRLRSLQKTQQKIKFNKNKSLIGKTFEALCEFKTDKQGCYVFRNQYNSKKVDSFIYVYTKKTVNIGSYYTVKITDYYEYDLKGNIV